MSKGQHNKRDTKKKATMTLKERKAAKRAKKASKNAVPGDQIKAL